MPIYFSSLSHFSFPLTDFIYSAVTTPAGSATMAIPKNEDNIAMVLPITVTGYISPYPTVVSETVDQYTASKNVLKDSGSMVNTTNAEMIIYPTAREPTAVRAFLELFNTSIMVLMPLEYLNILTIRNTFNISIKEEYFTSPIKGHSKAIMDIRSIMDINLKGYLTKDVQ